MGTGVWEWHHFFRLVQCGVNNHRRRRILCAFLIVA